MSAFKAKLHALFEKIFIKCAVGQDNKVYDLRKYRVEGNCIIGRYGVLVQELKSYTYRLKGTKWQIFTKN